MVLVNNNNNSNPLEVLLRETEWTVQQNHTVAMCFKGKFTGCVKGATV